MRQFLRIALLLLAVLAVQALTAEARQMSCQSWFDANMQNAATERTACVTRNWWSPGGYAGCQAAYYAFMSAEYAILVACRAHGG